MKNIIILAVIVIIVYFFIQFKKEEKKKYAIFIKKATNGDYETLIKYDFGYLKEWADAINVGSDKFEYKNKTYSTKTGRAA